MIHDEYRAKRHPPPALLALAVVAILAGMTCYEAIARYGQARGREFLRHLGFTIRRGLVRDIAAALAEAGLSHPPGGGGAEAEIDRACEVDKGHAGRERGRSRSVHRRPNIWTPTGRGAGRSSA